MLNLACSIFAAFPWCDLFGYQRRADDAPAPPNTSTNKERHRTLLTSRTERILAIVDPLTPRLPTSLDQTRHATDRTPSSIAPGWSTKPAATTNSARDRYKAAAAWSRMAPSSGATSS